jgi:hypothetical protein
MQSGHAPFPLWHVIAGLDPAIQATLSVLSALDARLKEPGMTVVVLTQPAIISVHFWFSQSERSECTS